MHVLTTITQLIFKMLPPTKGNKLICHCRELIIVNEIANCIPAIDSGNVITEGSRNKTNPFFSGIENSMFAIAVHL